MVNPFDACLLIIGAFCLGWGLAERSNRKSFNLLKERIDDIAKMIKKRVSE